MAREPKTSGKNKWNNPGLVEQACWEMRQSDLPRAENRAILNRLYNGDPPFNEEDAELNGVQINRNDLSGPNALSQGRRQWDQAFLKPGNFFSIAYDSGPPHKRREWAHSVTRNANRVLRKSRPYVEQARAAGGNLLLHGIGPSIWRNRRSVVCRAIFPGSLLIPSETEIDFDNLSHFAVFQEWTPAQLYNLTHGPKTDPGWDMGVVRSQLKYVSEQYLKQPNATAFQYMPERIEELFKQDLAFWGSDAVPTCDVWDWYFRDQEEGDNWYRRIILDWGLNEDGSQRAISSKGTDRTGKFLYSSGNKVFAKSVNEIFHCQFGDCSAVFPQMYHSIRSMGWMLWGVCDLENRLHCKFSEALFENLMWFFQVAGNSDLIRLQKADFHHMGVIPQGVNWLKASDRFSPNPQLLQMGFARYKQLMAENSSAFTQDFNQGDSGKEMTATETMARVNSVNALVSGMMTLAYTYEEFKDAEILRRLCIKGNPDPLAKKFRLLCFQDGVQPEMLDVDKMDISRERSMGGGNKTLEMAIVQFLQSIRKNVGPDGQRKIDHIAIETATDDANLAQEIAPMDEDKQISSSMHEAELSTDRILRGLPYEARPDAVYEDFVKVWLHDLTVLVGKDVQGGNMSTPDRIEGYKNLAQHIDQFLEIMSSDDEDKERVTNYKNNLADLMAHVKAFEQRLQQQAQAAARQQAKAQQNGGVDAKTRAEIQAKTITATAKAKIADQSHAQRTAQKQVSFEMEEQRKDRQHNAEVQRGNLRTAHDMALEAASIPGPFAE